MNRRLCLLGLLAGSEAVLASACSHPVPPALSSLTALGRHFRSDMIVRWPAQQLVPALADLPPGFSVGQELSPVLVPPAGPPGQGAPSDPWGR
ncbi:MAG TPA: hypothetical protein VHN78_02840, partial [Chloroflexota bacterium]|nr:hypothetical protein [Chloroflexota bacterium]